MKQACYIAVVLAALAVMTACSKEKKAETEVDDEPLKYEVEYDNGEDNITSFIVNDPDAEVKTEKKVKAEMPDIDDSDGYADDVEAETPAEGDADAVPSEK